MQQYLAVFLAMAMAGTFLVVPAHKKAPLDRLAWYDGLFSLLSFLVGLYVALFYFDIIETMGLLLPHRILLGAIAILLILEGTRRLLGWPILVILVIFFLYARFAYFFPGALYGQGVPWFRLVNYLYLDPNSLFGVALQVAATVVLSFVVFGQFLFSTGGGVYFTEGAMALFGRYRGGPAKVSVVASSLFGTMSGSAVANVVVDGPITIPMMIRTGYRPEVAAAVEAVASTGGQIMPPVMGAAAFLMATFLGIPYAQVAIAALLPAILYYLAVFIQVDLQAARYGLRGLKRDELPNFGHILDRGWPFLLPIGVLVYVLFFTGLEADVAGLYAAISVVLVSFFTKASRVTFSKLLVILERTGEGLLEIAVVSAVAGLIIGIVALTGLGFTFSQAVVSLAGGNFFLLLVLAAVAAGILGMGMTVTAAYILVVILVAPALVQLGTDPLTAHMFVFYFAVLSFLTPPVCLAVYAAAAIGGTDLLRTAFQAMRLAVTAYVVPFIFVYKPALLLRGSATEVAIAVVTAIGGVALLAIGVEGYLIRVLNWPKRVILIVAGLGLMTPGLATDALGLAIAAPVLLRELANKKALARKAAA
ncbi:MAG: TRAP transporter fused permease subunit [Deltaproteobacteria bacterium]|nr:TRAP transporter fused permease subunit [Deltaproteobacteria bacterium]